MTPIENNIPEKNGWHWMICRDARAVHMANVFTAENGAKMIAVYGALQPTAITIFHQDENIGKCEFVEIERPST